MWLQALSNLEVCILLYIKSDQRAKSVLLMNTVWNVQVEYIHIQTSHHTIDNMGAPHTPSLTNIVTVDESPHEEERSEDENEEKEDKDEICRL